jgi:hypothetical protein
MEEYFIKLAEYFENNSFVSELDLVDSEKELVNAAKNGSSQAQYICWTTYNAEQKMDDNKGQLSNLINRYISKILLKCQKPNKQMSRYFPWLKKAEKLRDEHERMIHSYCLPLIIKAITEGHECSRDDAIQALVQFAMQQTPKERNSDKTKFFERFNTISKLEKELKYYKQNYKNWTFLFENFEDHSFPRPFKFQAPGQLKYDTDVSFVFKSLLADLKVQNHNLR